MKMNEAGALLANQKSGLVNDQNINYFCTK